MHALMGRGGLLDDFFKDMNPGFYVRPLHGDPLPGPGQMKVDVHENEGGYLVSAEIPGVPKDEINVLVDGNIVTLRAEVRQRGEKTEGEKLLRSERYYGSVSRSFQMPSDLDADGCQAKYENGVLTLNLPKKQGGRGQRLTIA